MPSQTVTHRKTATVPLCGGKGRVLIYFSATRVREGEMRKLHIRSILLHHRFLFLTIIISVGVLSRAANDKVNAFIMNRYRNDSTFEKIRRIQNIAYGAGIPMAALALSWVLREPNVASAIVGASRPSQIEENAKASASFGCV